MVKITHVDKKRGSFIDQIGLPIMVKDLGRDHPLMWNYMRGDYFIDGEDSFENIIAYPEVIADEDMELLVLGARTSQLFRWTDVDNWYKQEHDALAATKDQILYKEVGAVTTTLATEAVDLTKSHPFRYKVAAVKSAIDCYRTDMTTPKLSVTDTSHASGYWGVWMNAEDTYGDGSFAAPYNRLLGKPDMASLKPMRYLEVPVVGSGTLDDPFRAEMPQKLATHPKFEKINPLALTHSAVIKSGKDGKPTDYRAIVRVFDQPDRQTHLKSISTCLTALKGKRGVKRLDKDEAKREALKLDDKLHMEDLSEW